MKIVALTLLALLLLGCPPNIKKETQFLEIDDFDSYLSPSATSPAIQKAARAVVRVDQSGTGFFISSDGLMMTNNHIIGQHNCALEGCFVTIDLEYQSDVPYSKKNSQELFAKPLYTSKDLDFTVVRLHNHSNGKLGDPYQASYYLNFSRKTVRELIGDKALFVVGHPNAGLKKVKIVNGFREQGRFLTMDDYVFGGNSGSPILNEQGEVVGILHSGFDASVTISRNGIQGWSYGTASADLIDMTGAGEPRLMAKNEGNVKKNFVDLDSKEFSLDKHIHLIGPSGRIPESVSSKAEPRPVADLVSSDGTVMASTLPELYSLYRNRCETAIAQLPDTEDELKSVSSPCFAKSDYMDCKSGLYCPEQPEAKIWLSIANKLFDAHLQYGRMHWDAMSLALSTAPVEDRRATRILMTKRYLETVKPLLTFELAYSLYVRGVDYVDPVSGERGLDYLMSFRSKKHHSKSFLVIAGSQILFYRDGLVNRKELEANLNYILNHRDLMAYHRTRIETVVYENDLMKLR